MSRSPLRLAALAATTLALAGLHATPAGAADEPLQGKQWALPIIEAPAAWGTATGAGTVVAVVDTGVDRDHPEFPSAKLVNGASWVGCGAGAKPCTSPSAWDDRNGHGTHVAGIAAAPRDGRGIAGVAPDAKVMPVRVLDADGSGSTRDVAAGIRWAANHGADVINLSLGGLPVASQLFDAAGGSEFSEAIAYAIARNVLVVAAAGNDAFPICANDSFVRGNAVCVGATDRRDLKSTYSNFGGGLDVVAPGGVGSVFCEDDAEDVLSTYAISEDTVCRSRVGYETAAGTSMAAPHVAGIGALLAQRGVRGAAAAARIAATADDLGSPGYDPVYGVGRVNARRAVLGL